MLGLRRGRGTLASAIGANWPSVFSSSACSLVLFASTQAGAEVSQA
jgi:hypothetical protein